MKKHTLINFSSFFQNEALSVCTIINDKIQFSKSKPFHKDKDLKKSALSAILNNLINDNTKAYLIVNVYRYLIPTLLIHFLPL